MFWDRQLLADRHVLHNRSDVQLVYKTGPSAYIIDVAICYNSNIEHVEKKVNYEPLRRKIKEICGLGKVVVISIILSTTSMVPLTACVDVLGLSQILVHTYILHTCSMMRGVIEGFSHKPSTGDRHHSPFYISL